MRLESLVSQAEPFTAPSTTFESKAKTARAKSIVRRVNAIP